MTESAPLTVYSSPFTMQDPLSVCQQCKIANGKCIEDSKWLLVNATEGDF